MFGLTLLDIVLIGLLIWQLFYGWRVGLLISLCGVLGFAVGAVAAFFAVPVVSSWVTDSGWRLTAVVAAALLLMVVGHWLGIVLGRQLSKGVKLKPLRAINRVLGAVAAVVIAALLISPVAFSISALGIPFLSSAISGSGVIRTIDSLTPTPLKQAIAQLRSTVVSEGIPQLFNQLAPVTPVSPPDARTDTPVLNEAGQSVLKITGTAFQCGQNQTGSGFVISENRVMTNAHVVAGVSQPVVEVPGSALPGKIVYFDSEQDLAVIEVDGLKVKPLSLGSDLALGAQAAFDGYPLGGPFQSKPAAVQSKGQVLVPNIYGANKHFEEVYQIAGDVQPGNSGGPLLDLNGNVTGVVFAKADSDIQVGYAFTLAEIAPVVKQAAGLQQQVSSGSCVQK
ncbi:S1-C subfamily serine protease [Psychromicrobium silvestre]|uniref:S1-C subfamily serine protease n=1 Tax=Psychromicrobium silvestre TaxID=1645614 RepID=A0A7Y9S6Q9_9MICC|nr:MarP family serine protease [Psychromicrobium silvestre]NYE95599.1 S1-C subfamily serine protease [Psychromicrobium silvestre]